MRKEIRPEQVVIKEKEVYIAEDGTEFDTRWKCTAYEHEKLHKPLLDNLQECEDLRYIPNFDGQEYPEHHDYRWFYIRNLDDVVILNKVYPNTIAVDDYYIGKWVCLEENDDCDGWMTTIEDGIDYATKVLTTLGYKVEITKEA